MSATVSTFSRRDGTTVTCDLIVTVSTSTCSRGRRRRLEMSEMHGKLEIGVDKL